MNGNYTLPGRGGWKLPSLIACNLIALMLAFAWYCGWAEPLVAPLDTWLFSHLNSTLADGEAWQRMWAVANTKRFDALTALFMLSLLLVYTFSGKRSEMAGRAAACVLIVLSIVVVMQVSKLFLGYGRAGPSTTLDPVIRLSHIVTDIKFKDWSGDSFPGDHGIILLMFTTMMWYYAGRSYGLIMVAYSAIMIWPRLVVGGHWASDYLVGSTYVGLMALGWLLATPLHHTLMKPLARFTGWSLNLGERMLSPLVDPPERLGHELSKAPLNLGKGFCMGTADIIPGVSGGTMALILGIYERLLNAIRSVDKAWLGDVLRLRLVTALARNDLLFLAPLGVGIIAAILFFTRIVPLPTLIVSHPEQVYGLFFGLILASIVVLMGEVERYGARQVLMTLLGAAAGFAVVTLVPVETPTALWFIFLCGFIAISAMLLPGISGSFILLILGKYAYIVGALGVFDLPIIAAFIAGALTGLVVFSRAILWLLNHYHQATLLFIKGILIGSLWAIWPFQERVYEVVRHKERLVSATPVWPEAFDGAVMAAIALAIAGFVAVMLIHRAAGRKS